MDVHSVLQISSSLMSLTCLVSQRVHAVAHRADERLLALVEAGRVHPRPEKRARRIRARDLYTLAGVGFGARLNVAIRMTAGRGAAGRRRPRRLLTPSIQHAGNYLGLASWTASQR